MKLFSSTLRDALLRRGIGPSQLAKDMGRSEAQS